MHKLTRIAYNTSGWKKPSGDARIYETENTYNHQQGFGHEEWLFRHDWLIDGWRYAFIQGVNKSRERLLRDGAPLDLTLFTIEPDKRRRFVATISSVECLEDQQAKDAVAEFRRRGWIETMRQEIQAAGGNVDAFGSGEYAPYVVNVRFRLDTVTSFPPDSYAPIDHPIYAFTRYQLHSLSDEQTASMLNLLRAGSPDLPNTQPFPRGATPPVECTPEHARMQKQLMLQLQAEYPSAEILREDGFIDVTVRTPEELILFEIKSDRDPRAVIRQALGQILEYAYHPVRSHSLPRRLVIVGRSPLSAPDETYLRFIQQQFRMPLSYRIVPI